MGTLSHLAILVVVASVGLEAGHEGLVEVTGVHPAVCGGRDTAEFFDAVGLASAHGLTGQSLSVGAEAGLR